MATSDALAEPTPLMVNVPAEPVPASSTVIVSVAA
jgi:hypothetical protein